MSSGDGPYQPDVTDWKIITKLRQEHKTNSAIARELAVSEGTVRQRLARLKDAGILEVKALINPDVLENQQLALIAVNVARSEQLDAKAREIAGLDNVLAVSLASGRYDLFAEVLVDSNHGLVEFLTEELSRVKDIVTTESFLMLRNYHKLV